MFKNTNWSLFLKEVENCRYVICIGAGQRLQRVIEILHEKQQFNKIKYIADNDPNKQGTMVVLNDKMIEIQSVPSLVPLINSNVIVIITCLYYADILKQLEEYDEFKIANVYSLTHLLGDYCDDMAMKKQIPVNLKWSESIMIPKKIHYCWFGGNPIPDKYKVWMDSWNKYCPDYEIVEWNESNYDISKNKYMLQAYEQKKWGFVPDYARLDIIYNYGGIYLDTDVELIKNLDHLLYQKGFAGFESNQFVALGLGFGAAQGNTLIKGMMDAYDEYSFLNSDGRINLTASPVIQTNYLLQHGLQQNGEYQILDGELTIFPEKMLSGKSITSKRIRLASYTCAIHHYDGSWLDDDKRNIIMQVENEMNII